MWPLARAYRVTLEMEGRMKQTKISDVSFVHSLPGLHCRTCKDRSGLSSAPWVGKQEWHRVRSEKKKYRVTYEYAAASCNRNSQLAIFRTSQGKAGENQYIILLHKAFVTDYLRARTKKEETLLDLPVLSTPVVRRTEDYPGCSSGPHSSFPPHRRIILKIVTLWIAISKT
jgi:hypothetical protein